jgi:hypothetical protein
MAKDKNEAPEQEQELTREQQLNQQLKEEELQRRIRDRRSDIMDRADSKQAQAGSDGTKAMAAAGAAVLLTVLTGGVLLPLVAVGVAAYYGSKSMNEKQQAREDRDYAMALSEGSRGGYSQEKSQAQGREQTEPEKSPEEKVEDKVRSESEQYQAAYGAIDGSLKAAGVKGKAEDKYKLINSIVKNGGYDQIDSKEELQERTQLLTKNIQDELNIPGVQGVKGGEKGEIGQEGLDISSKNGRYKRNAVDLIKEAGAAAGRDEDWHERRTNKREENLAKQDVRRDVRQGVNNYVVKPAATAVDYTVVKPAKAVAGAAVGTAKAAGKAANAANNAVNPFRRGVNAKKRQRINDRNPHREFSEDRAGGGISDDNRSTFDDLVKNPTKLGPLLQDNPLLVGEFIKDYSADAPSVIKGSGLDVDLVLQTSKVDDAKLAREVKGEVSKLEEEGRAKDSAKLRANELLDGVPSQQGLEAEIYVPPASEQEQNTKVQEADLLGIKGSEKSKDKVEVEVETVSDETKGKNTSDEQEKYRRENGDTVMVPADDNDSKTIREVARPPVDDVGSVDPKVQEKDKNLKEMKSQNDDKNITVPNNKPEPSKGQGTGIV